MKKVEGITFTDESFKGRTYYGFTECCNEFVKRDSHGEDDRCPKCGELLNWYSES